MSDDPRRHYARFLLFASLADRLEAHLPADVEWCAVVRFYSALHLVDAYLTTKFLPHKTVSHFDRQQALRRYPECARFERAYRRLQQLSEEVRYEPLFVYNAGHHAEARRLHAKVTAVVEPWVQELLDLP